MRHGSCRASSTAASRNTECLPFVGLFGTDFWVGVVWGIGSTSALIGLIAAFGGYRVLGLAIHGRELWYFTALWIVASLLIGFAEELQFRAYLLATVADGIGFWSAAILLSIGFGALHYFLKPHERWEDFASTGLLGLFMCFTLRRTGSLAFAIGFHAAFDFANLFAGRDRTPANTPWAICSNQLALVRNGSPAASSVPRQVGWYSR